MDAARGFQARAKAEWVMAEKLSFVGTVLHSHYHYRKL